MNLQAIEKQTHREDGALEIVGKPFLTIQGEGPSDGIPAVFIRSAGCNLQCGPCDTDYTTDRRLVSVDRIHEEVQELPLPPMTSQMIAVITGGEPFRQNITPLVERLKGIVFYTEIETNGTLPPSRNLPTNNVYLICSPKAEINRELGWRVDFLKYVVQAGKIDPEDGLPTESILGVRPGRIKRFPASSIYIQPCDPGGDCDAPYDGFYEYRVRENMKAAVESCLRFGYRLSCQIHKVAGLD